jgi:hypothetical protein
MQSRWPQLETVSVLEFLVRVRSLVLWSLCFVLGASHLAAQPRPVLLQPKRDFLAGRLVLIPFSTEPDALGIPRQLAPIADHEIVTPPASLLAPDQTAALNRWANEYDFADIDGLLVATDKISAATLHSIRARYRHLSLFGFGQNAEALRLVSDNTLDFLLFTGNAAAEAKLPTERIAYLSPTPHAASFVLARWLNQRFGFAPQFQMAASSTAGNALAGALARQVAALGGNLVTREAAHISLFLHSSNTTETNRALLLDALLKNVNAGVRAALVDVAETEAERTALRQALRERKLLDRLTAFASVNTQALSAEAACQRALAQASLWLIPLRFLRDDIERIRRVERNQIGASLSAWLRDAVFPALALAASGSLAERETQAQTALRPEAETIFNEQFKGNVHAVRRNTGERVEFMTRFLQRLQVRFDEATNAPPLRPEIRIDVNLLLLDSLFIVRDFPRADWQLNHAQNLDPRLITRFQAIAWQTFKMDVNEAEITIKLSNKATDDALMAQSYSLNSRRSGQTRRVTINAANPQGAFYALAHLEQLGANGQLAQDFQFTEKPALAERFFFENPNAAWSHRERLEMISLAGRARLNVFVHAARDNHAARQRELTQAAADNFVTLVNASSQPPRFIQPPCETFPLSAWALLQPALGSSSPLACAPNSARLARLPLAWLGAYGWSGKALDANATLTTTLNWLFEGKARDGLRPWLEASGLFASLFEREAPEINAPLLADQLRLLEATLPQFDTTREQGLLRGALRAFLQDAQRRLSALADDARYERLESGAYRRRNP